MVNFNVSVYYRVTMDNIIVYVYYYYPWCYVKSTRVVEKQLESRQRQLGKTAVIKAGAYIVSTDRKTNVYGLEACESRFLRNAYQRSIATRQVPIFR